MKLYRFVLPDRQIQDKIVSEYEKLIISMRKLEEIKLKIHNRLNVVVTK